MYGRWLVIFVLPALARAQHPKLDADPPRPCDEYAQAEQVHLSYAGPNSLWVTWLTFHNTSGSIVEYGVDRRDKEARANVSSFVDGSAQSKPRFVHRALLDTLEPGKRYSYRVGSECGWSDLLSFVALAPRPDGSFKYAFYGDMGAKNAESVGKLQDEAQNGGFDMVLHIGDFAYNFEDMGDEFMRQIEPIAAYVPYMTVVGNHEYQGKSFPHYKNRFTMPGLDDNLFYSFDLGHVHFIAFSTEFYYGNGNYNVSAIIKQWNWIKDDLEKANDNREKVPRIITMGHRPMYCDTRDQDYCNYADNSMRIGINRNSSGLYQYGLEDLFYAYGVDMELWAHEHIYERMYPVYNRTVFKGTGDPYTDPPAPVHVVAGSAGCKENTDVFEPTLSPWTAFTSTEYGFSRMQVFNETHIYLEQAAALNDTKVDHIWLVKHSHKPYDANDLARLKQFGTFIGSD